MQSMLYLRATIEARNPILQVVITHASQVCSQHSFGLPLRMNGMHRTHLIMRVLAICHVKLTQSIEMAQKRFDLRSLSPALSNLWLLLI